MEEQTRAPIENVPQKPAKTKPLLMTLLAAVLIFVAAEGVYLWQHNKVVGLNSQVHNLHSQLSAKATSTQQSTVTNKISESSATFTYAPKTGGLSLTLPKSYGVIVNVDGNKGGAPGATFRVASATNSNVFTDGAYQGIQVNIDNTFKGLNGAVQSEESILDEQRGAGSTQNRNYKTSDATVAGLPAKLLTADGLDEYQGNVSVYLVGSGSFLYTITANSTQNSSFPMLDAVLNGLTIKPVTL